ncbi:hypothetical protein SteCoe_27259 [Stentor coeruleus]|uniref:Uncharacterized protein n=1 Tax=Stentor coeruleus TaxID=5963 RepID=A0A1R2BBG6_9CILI|nr:hypothetical protein SteCoe_27259 [Stentor coeruleus]
MECLEELLEGKAQALDIPIDSMKTFVEKFNSEIPSKYPNCIIEADINDLERAHDTISLKWKVQTASGVLSYNISDNKFILNIN